MKNSRECPVGLLKKTVYVLIIFMLFSCSRFSVAKETEEYSNTQTPLQGMDVVQAEPEEGWLLIGGQKVRSYGSDEKYYRKSDIENITSLSLLVNPENETCAASLEGIEQLENLKEVHIYLYRPSMNTLDYSPLNALQNLKSITFECGEEYKMIKIPDLSGLASRNNIVRIEFNQCALISMDNIEFLPNLAAVLIYNNYAGLSDLKSLNQLSRLERLYISSLNKEGILPWAEYSMYSLDEKSVFRIEEFSSLGKLKYLELDGGEVDAKGIEYLSALEEVTFGSFVIIKNSQYISGLRGIKRLEITINDQEPDIQFLGKNMIVLDALFIYAAPPTWGGATEDPYQILDVTPIGDIPLLTSLVLRGFILKNLEALDKLENMEGRILVRDCIVTDKSGTTKWELLYDLGDLGGR